MAPSKSSTFVAAHGRIVLYVLRDGTVRPAVILGINAEDETLDLLVLMKHEDGNADDLTRTGVNTGQVEAAEQGDAPGQWFPPPIYTAEGAVTYETIAYVGITETPAAP